MDKKSKIKISVVIVMFSLSIIMMLSYFFSISDKNKLYIVDNAGKPLATLTGLSPNEITYEGSKYKPYVDIVIDEAIEYITEHEGCDREEAGKKLFKKGYTIHTTFDRQIFDASKNAYQMSNLGDTPFATAVTDTDGKILSLFSSSNKVNYAVGKVQPYSALDPLSIYAPAIGNKITSWSTMYDNMSLADGIKFSNNGISSRCLKDLGVQKSVDFLSSELKINLDEEKNIIAADEEKVFDAISSGNLTAGVSPLDMAGYYQIFVNGGKYVEPYTIEKIVNSKDEVVFESYHRPETVINHATAYIVNELLQNTLSDGGTAEKAKYKQVLIGGKTGEDDDNNDNWFVGFTPEYSFSIWHGKDGKNKCPEISSRLVSGFEIDMDKKFNGSREIQKSSYCTESGKEATPNCPETDIGCYLPDTQLPKCDIH